jgi:F-type H+-transporting ATPase subunit delta
MAETTTIARPYAEAIFRLADQNGALAAWAGTLEAMAQVAGNPEMQRLLGNPKITRSQLADLFISACKGLNAEGKNLVHLLVHNGRLALLPQVRELFEQLKHEREGTVEALIHSAFPIDNTQKASLVAGLERKLGKRIQASVAIDPELIGGVKVVVGDQVIDGSVRGRLAAMAAALKS